MKDNNIYRKLRIVFLSLAIISTVFTLCYKVGHCADSGSSVDGFYPLDYPLPINGSYFGSSFHVTQEVIDSILAVSQNDYNDCIIIHEESLQENYIQVEVYEYGEFGFQPHIVNDIYDSSFAWKVVKSSFIQYDFDTNTATFISLAQSSNGMEGFYLLPYYGFDVLPNGNYYLPYNVYIGNYPLWVNSGVLSSQGVTYFQNYNPDNPGHSIGGGLVTDMPTFDSLPSSPSSNDDTPTLFGYLKGWLSTISGNIYKGFKNIEENLTSFFKPYLDNTKQFFEWVFAEPDGDAIKDAFLDSDLMTSVEDSKTAITGLYGMFSTPNPSCPSFTIPINATGGVFHNMPDIVISFAWYENIRSIVTPVIVLFVTLTCVFSVINSIPDIFHGKSGERNVNT